MKELKPIRIATHESVQRITDLWAQIKVLAAKSNVTLAVQDGTVWFCDDSRPDRSDWPFIGFVDDDDIITFIEIDPKEFPADFASLLAARAANKPW